MRTLMVVALLAGLGACGGDDGDDDGDDAATDDGPDAAAPDASPDAAASTACTAADQHVAGTAVTYSTVQLEVDPVGTSRLLTSSSDVAAAFPNGDAPTEIANADFTMDRVVLGKSNPEVDFAVDDGAKLVIGENTLCVGVAPRAVAFVVHGTTKNTLSVFACPYTGPDPCTAP